MKVLYDHQIFASQIYGGISRYFVEVGERLAAVPGIDANVLCPLYVNAYLDPSRSLRVHGRHVKRPPKSSIAMRMINAAFSPWFRRVRNGVNIYHETYFSRLDLAPKAAARIITVHDMIHEKFPDSFPKFDLTREAKRAAIMRADHVVCVSDNTRRDLLEIFPLPPEKVSVIYHGSSLRAANVPASERKPQLLYVGGRGRYKNFIGLLQAFGASHLPGEGFSIICFGGDPLSAQEHAEIARLGLVGHVAQCGGSDEALVKLFAESTALVYPSLYEGFGIPPLEAMSCGCPVACSNSSSLPEVVGDAAVTFDPKDQDSICSAIEAIALHPARMNDLVAAGHSQAARFSWDASSAKTLGVYQSVC